MGGAARVLDRLVSAFTSLYLTVTCLALGFLLVFLGTIAQVEVGLYRAQNEYFRSFLVFWQPAGAAWKIPVLPGGYLIGGLLLINLVASLLSRFAIGRRTTGVWLVHVGLILLLLGQLLTDMLSVESGLQMFEGETKNYSEDFRRSELALIDRSDPKTDTVYAIGDHRLAAGGVIAGSGLPVTLRVQKYWPNATLADPSKPAPAGATVSGASTGLLKDALVVPAEATAGSDSPHTPAAVVEVSDGKTTAGIFLVSAVTSSSQSFKLGGKDYELTLRFRRYYQPFSLTLLKATHETYRGTDIPKNFASRVRVEHASRNETRETLIKMNSPLRYGGLTFYQYQMSAGEMAARAGLPPSSTLQVVRNPSWLTPYLSCVMVSLGLLIQFGTHLVSFARRRNS